MSTKIHTLSTEQMNSKTNRLDDLSLKEQIHLMNTMNHDVIQAVEAQIEAIEKVIHEVSRIFLQGGRIFYFGAGTSGRIGILDAVETVPTFGLAADRFSGVLAGGSDHFSFAGEEAEDSLELGQQEIGRYAIGADDMVIGIAASGRTPYVIGALKEAKRQGAMTAAIACNKQSLIAQQACLKVEVDCGPEFITGSTRLKAGTAQKIILNMISTLAMVQSGRTCNNLMVDVEPSNEKLVERWKGIVMKAADISYDAASELFIKSNKNAKVAILMAVKKCDCEIATSTLNQHHGFLSKAIASMD